MPGLQGIARPLSLAGTVRPHRPGRTRPAGTGKIAAPRFQPGRSPLSRLGFGPLGLVRRPAAPAADESPVAALPGRAEGECPRRLCRQRNRPRPGKTHPPRRRHLHDRRDLRSLCTGADKKRRYQRDRTRHRQRRTVKMNAVRRRPAAGRRGPADCKKIRQWPCA